MAEQEITVPVDDKGMLSDLMSEPRQEAPAEREQTAEAEQPRDEQGRFAPKQADNADAAPIQPQPVEAAKLDVQPEQPQTETIGVRQLREAHERAERRAEEARFQSYALQQQLQQRDRELAELRKPKAEPTDFFADPNTAFQERISPLEAEFQHLSSRLMLRASRAENVAAHGREAISEMEKAIEAALQSGHPDMPLLSQRMRASDDPVGEAMQWYQRDKLLKETGGDLTSYRTKTLDEALKDPAFLAKAIEAARSQAGAAQQADGRPNIQLPPSLNKATGTGTSLAGSDDGDMSDRALFRHAMAPGRR